MSGYLKRIVLTYTDEYEHTVLKHMMESLRMQTGKAYHEIVFEAVKLFNNSRHTKEEVGN